MPPDPSSMHAVTCFTPSLVPRLSVNTQNNGIFTHMRDIRVDAV